MIKIDKIKKSKTIACCAFLLIVIGIFFYFTSEKNEFEDCSSLVGMESVESKNEEFVTISGVVQKGQTYATIIGEYFSGRIVQDILKVSDEIHPLKNIRLGQVYTIIWDKQKNQFKRFEYEINQSKKLVVEQTSAGVIAWAEPIKYDYQLICIDGIIDTTLFDAVVTAGESPSLAISLVNIFGAEIDFIKDVRVGDTFCILVEKCFRDGIFKGYGRVLAAKITNNGTVYEGYNFQCEKGCNQYYTSTGKSLKRMFLKAPLDFTRISSGYSLCRKHPIHRDKRPHLGIDYAAPMGTPVKTVGDGVIKKVGWLGGFGKVVIVKHKNGFESMYGHLSGFSCNTRVGKHIKQGQIIGFVGATGVATGPHLDFRMKHKGNYVNPIKMMNPRLGEIAPSKLEEYKHFVLELKSYMNGTQSCSNYKPDKIL